ncbi:ABC-2 type transport system ATP-binding protein [Actinoplanes campanulatus]|uniref:ABC-2 type transport system ATP-binding protein n=1 Tax=Actinoplanes campanulatus TaxID=113559 RepID=A0A7W5AP47_9ACTN|nr:ABC transporter ATP-binding protein [Actinoplanes campanulatus]MBB3099856.1 ABC-2 type transport system ATP-binding protein [Actinoplanes campanulatus]GGN47463.1 multidrug ABC transporter ATP-binding protein [Actinoplanes campanulatus]GID40415.1 multidrug ABC transporter ATP-binding protein [Actinoplanes campanulatus]
MIHARAESVTRRFGATIALDHVDFEVRRGEMVGLLGPNGAGKSTLVGLLTGSRRPTSGRVELCGGDPRDPASRRTLGVTPQETGLPASLRVGEVVDFVRAHFPDPLPRDELLDRFGLSDLIRRQTGGLSGGQRRRLAVALAFAGRPEIVFLDEPTTGLDVEARRALWESIREFHAGGGTVVLTSHYLEEIEALASRVVVLAQGRVLADDSVAAVRGLVGIRRISLTSAVPLTDFDFDGLVSVERAGDRVHLLTPDADRMVRTLVSHDVPFCDLEVRPTSLEEAFLAMTGKDAQ